MRILKQGKWVATPFTGPLEPGPQQGRVGRRKAGRPAARRRVRGGRRGDGRVRDDDGRGAVQRRHARAQGQDPPAQPAEALAQRAGGRDRSASARGASCTRRSRQPARRASRRRRSSGSSGRLPGTPRATRAGLLPSLAVHSAGATACAQIPSNQSGPSARPAAGLREIERSDSGEESEGRRRAGARRAVRAARAAGGAPGPSPAARPGGRARRVAGGAREALREAAAVPGRVVVLDLAAPADRQRVPGRRAAPARAPVRAARRGPRARHATGTRPGRPRPPSFAPSSAPAWPRSRRRRRRSSCSRTRSSSASRRSRAPRGCRSARRSATPTAAETALRERLSA